MPFEYIYGHARKTLEGGSGGGFVLQPSPESHNFELAASFVRAVAHPILSLTDPPTWAYTLREDFGALSRTSTMKHFGERPPVEMTHLLLMSPTEKLFLTEGPVFALRNYHFRETLDPSAPPCAAQNVNQIVKFHGAIRADAECPEWIKSTGDCGWAGHTISKILEEIPVIIVYNPQTTDILNLLAELYERLPAVRRWQTSFNTRVGSVTRTSHQILCFEECSRNEAETLWKRFRKERIDAEFLDLSALSKTPPPEGPWPNFVRTGEYETDLWKTTVNPSLTFNEYSLQKWENENHEWEKALV